MSAFQINGSGTLDLRSVSLSGFDGLTFSTSGTSTAQINASQFGVGGLQGSPITFTGDGQSNTLEFFVSGGTFSLASVVFANWSANDAVIFRDSVGTDNITGTTQNDLFYITGGNDILAGGGGVDTVNIDWSAIGGNFSMNGAGQINNFAGTSLSFSGISSLNILLGGGNDSVALGAGNDTMNGGAGDDTLNSGLGNAVIDGGIGTDVWIADFSNNATAATVNVNLIGVHAAGNGSTYNNIERLNLTGGVGDDVFISTTGNSNNGFNDSLFGGAGNDKLTVGGGSDFVDGGDGIDTLTVNYSTDLSSFVMNGSGVITDFTNTQVQFTNIEKFNVTLGAGNDNVVLGAGSDTLNGGAGNDTLNTGAGAAVVDGGTGNDTWAADLSADTGAKSIDIRLAGVHAAGNGTTYANLEALNVLTGAGNDLLATLNGLFNDTLNGGGGNDTLAVGGGVDVVDGGSGTDLLIINYSGINGDFTMNGGGQITNFGNTTISFTGIEQFNVTLGVGNDSVTLGAGADTLRGLDGNDTLNTGIGDAVVDGGNGNDLWIADQSGDSNAKSINLNLTGLQTAGTGTTYEDIERISITTGGGNDQVISQTASGGNDTVSTGDGNDTIGVGAGDDNVDGGLGTDTLIINYAAASGDFSMNGPSQINNFAGTSVSFAGIEDFNVTLGAGNDNVVLGAFDDTINGGAGNDVFNTAAGLADVDGGLGTDRWLADLSAATANMTVDITLAGRVAAGDGSFYAQIEALNLTTGSGNDQIVTQHLFLDDVLSSGAGNDTLTVAGGNDQVDGGADNDLLIIDYTGIAGNFTMNGVGQINNFAGTSVSFTNIERFNVTLGDGTNTITLLNGNDTVKGGAGNDVFNTAVGAAVVDGGAGLDTWIADQSGDNTAKVIDLNLSGVQVAGNGTTYANIEGILISTGSGKDLITTFNGNFNDNVSTGAGNDIIKVFGGNDGVDGGIGNDLLIIDYSAAGGSFSMNGATQINNFAGTSVTFAGIERINATFGVGADNVTLTAGNDTISGGLGNDTMNGGLGSDTMDWRTATTGISLTVNATGGGAATATGIGTDTFTGFENFWLGSGNDVLHGNAFANLIDGGAGKDKLYGGNQSDTLIGGDGNDVLNGGKGHDYLTGGIGADMLTGGSTPDTFIYNSAAESGILTSNRDRIVDFLAGSDKIDLHAIDAVPGGLDDAFHFLGVAAAFTAIGDLRLEQVGLDTLVRLNLDADLGSEASILLLNVTATSLTATDFIL